MAGGTNDDDEIITAINVTPLVDIVLVLLIILMVTASYIVSKSIPMDLPQAQSGETPPSRQLEIELNAEGQLFVDQAPVTWEQLEARARQVAAAHREEARAVIGADRSVSHGDFIRIVDLLRGAGITKYAISVDPQRDREREE